MSDEKKRVPKLSFRGLQKSGNSVSWGTSEKQLVEQP